MKRKRLIIILLSIGVLFVCAAILATMLFTLRFVDFSNFRLPVARSLDFTAEAQVDQTFTVDGPAQLFVENLAGPVRVEVGPPGEVTVQGVKKAQGWNQSEAEENLDRLDVNMTQDENLVRVTVEVNQEGANSWGGSVDFIILVPEQTQVQVTTDFGELELSGTRGDAELATTFGAVKVRDVQGTLTVSTRNGRVEASGIQAGQEEIDLKSEFGDVSLRESTAGPVTLRSNNGTILLRDVEAGGLVNLRSEFGRVEFIGGEASTLEVQTLNGGVTLEDLSLSGGLTAQSDFGALRLVGVAAEGYDLKTKNGGVHIDEVTGVIQVSSDFGEIEITNAAEAVLALKSGNGPIRFEGSLGEGPHTLRSNFGAILLSLPQESSFDFDLKTDFGKIVSEFEVTIQGEPDEDHWVGRINDGGPLLTVLTQNGNITLENNQ